MYENVLGAVTPVVAASTTAVVLPNTGVGSSVVTVAASILAGMVVWGVSYARANR